MYTTKKGSNNMNSNQREYRVGNRVKTYSGEIGIIVDYGDMFDFRVEITKWNRLIYGYDKHQLTTPSLLERVKWALLK